MSSTTSILRAGPRDRASIAAVLDRLPELEGRPIHVSYLPFLHARRGRLSSGEHQPGQPVHAASFIRARRIVLDHALRSTHGELVRVILHELFHFAWVRLGNPVRASYEGMLRHEIAARARGELGWSAESRKRNDRRWKGNTPAARRAWRDYLCESFCDTGAWLYGGMRRHDEFTLARRHRDRRAEWFALQFGNRPIPL
ncbi:MAG TPA: hypothetical protein VHD76_17115 [Bryobacteraceae bacterium]|jgi:hypothetical protein|nr:hypothetical protein [Bryobacteraceae bacterium]